jgi:hypothetical protein
MKFSIEGTAANGENASFTPVINPDGTYKQKLSAGSFTFSAGSYTTIKLPYEGKKYTLQLEPVGPNWNRNRESADGIVQDYVWKPTGAHLVGDGDINNHTHWYGGSIANRLSNIRQDTGAAALKIPEGTKCVFTLTPKAEKTIDGQPAKPLTIERPFRAGASQCDALNDLPIAPYELTGEVHLADGTKKPMLWNTEFRVYKPAISIVFEPGRRTGVEGVRTEWFVE